MDAQSVSMEAESSTVVSMEVESAAMEPEDAEMEAESESMIERYITMHHQHDPKENQCSSILVRHIKAPLDIIWSLVRKFDEPQRYKPFVKDCTAEGHFRVGSIRIVYMRTGLPATTSTEILERLDEEEHILGIKIVDGDHRLKNYSSVITVHKEEIDGREGTMVIESFIVDVPEGNTDEETCYFVRALINCNMKNLFKVSKKIIIMREQAAGLPAADVVNGN